MPKRKISRLLRRNVCAHGDVDERTFDRWDDNLPIREHSRERIERACVELGLSHLLVGAEPVDPESAEDLSR